MLSSIKISEKGKKKIQLYTAATYLFNKGKSHPQIVKILEEFEPDRNSLILIVDKAMHEKWDKLYLEANKLFSDDLIYDEVLKIISQKEADTEIAYWICNEWYKYKSFYADCIISGKTNRLEGAKWMIICGLAVIVLFYMNASVITKTIWSLAFLGSTIQWIVGMQQRDIANTINQFFITDIEEVDPENGS